MQANAQSKLSSRTKLRTVIYASALLFGVSALAADTDWIMKPMAPNLDDTASLQRGANLYVNFCLGCHSLKHQRYERTADDLGSIPHELMESNVIFTDQKIGEHIESSMSEEDAKGWFGAAPPDLTMVTRVRSPEWVYNFLLTFYEDTTRPFGVNNKVFANVGMPHALLPLQGLQEEVCFGKRPVDLLKSKTAIDQDRVDSIKGSGDDNCGQLAMKASTGIYSAEEFDQAAFDISNFLHYVGDPTRAERESLGKYVIGFLLILLVLAYFLNRNYWKDVKSD
ncbi:MAG: cytochrome c1 [Gammaproteobacteria bacterium]|nr:cytochrome c1 [Gammaproteobacteria bacterium]